MRILLVPLAVSLALAGCLADATPPLASDGGLVVESSGLAHLAAAQEKAASWDASARLMAVTATEGEAVHGQIDPPLSWNTAADPALGNGKAVVWTYAFSGKNASVVYYVSIAGDGTELYARALPLPYYWHYAEPVHSGHGKGHPATAESRAVAPQPPAHPTLRVPAIDSDAAAQAALAYAPFADFAAAHPRHMVTTMVVDYGDRVGWGIVKNTATYFGVAVVIDGETGQLVERHEWPTPPPPPCTDADCYPPPPEPRPEDLREEFDGAAPGRLSSGGYVGDAWVHHFEVLSAHWFRDATITLRPETLPTEHLWMRILDPSGHEVHGAVGSGVLESVLPWAQPGTYTIEVRQDGLAVRDVPFTGSVHVRYDDPAWRETFQQTGQLSVWMGPFDLPFGVHQAKTLDLAVTFGEALPGEGIRWELEGPGGVVESGETAVEDLRLRIENPEDGSWRLRIWPQPQTVRPIDVSAVVEIEHGDYGCCWAH